MILVVVLAILGWFRGLIAQLASVAAIVGGVWVGAVVKQWVGGHWNGAHPTVIFWALTWVVTVLASLTVISLLNVLGDKLGQAIQSGPLGWLDRGLGIVAGAALGVVFASFMVLAAARLPMGATVERSLHTARAPRPLLEGGEAACVRFPRFPGACGLKKEFAFARRKWVRESPVV